MSKVKKATGVTGKRNTKGRKRAKAKTDEKRARSQSKKTTKRTGSVAKASSAPSKRKRMGTGTRKEGTRGSRKPVASRVKGKGTVKKTTRKGTKSRLTLGRGRAVPADTPVVSVAIRELDPLRKCGPNTTVRFLYRVDESVDGRRTAHLVFFDRHGWYCEHGRTCPAVGHAKKYNGQIARVS